MKFSYLALLFSSMLCANTANAAVGAVNSHTCKQLRGTSQPFMLVLKTGENVAEAILQCANDANLSGASLSGLGALKNPTLTFFNVKTKQYQNKTFEGVLELDTLSGNITTSNGKRIVHMHTSLSDDEYRMMGGHLGNAIVGPTTEITITPLKGALVKKMDKEAGIELIAT